MLKERLFTYPGSGSTWVVCDNLKIKKIIIYGLMGQTFELYSNDSIYGTVVLGYSNQCIIDLTKTTTSLKKIISKNIQKISDALNGAICTIKIFYEED